MDVQLAYGRNGLNVQLPDGCDVVTSRFVTGVADEGLALQRALRNPIGTAPLTEKVRASDKVVIVHSDITRATPNDRILPVILAELEAAGIDPKNITLMNALGTHRPQTDAELRMMLGDRIVETYRCLQHDAFDDSILTPLGKTKLGHPVRVNRHYLDADVRILTGFIEPHFFAGFSGGPKGVLPALAGEESVMSNHGRNMIAHERAAWGITEGNPIWEEMREVALMTDPTFLLNVTLNVHKEITGVFAGEMLAAHAEGCKFVREQAMVAVDAPYDVVVTTNSGYPLDQNLYQCVKGMSAARQVVAKGGAILMAGACQDGLPDHGRYAELLARGGSPQGVLDLLAQPGFGAQDQWQVQVQAMIQLHADVYVYSDGLTDRQIRDALFEPSRDVGKTVEMIRDAAGKDTRICVLPEGPQTVAYLKSAA
jgi:nickel-dependent lactate racemase